jgi:L-ascorbate metabolism protein UlaG (beta-lactamase superfamily)
MGSLKKYHILITLTFKIVLCDERFFTIFRMKNTKFYFIFIFLLIFFSAIKIADAQKKSSKEEEAKPDPHLSQKDNDYIDRQAKVFLDSINAILSSYPPVIHEGCERGYAKMLMDAVFHEQYAAFRKPVKSFFHTRIDKIIQDLEKIKVEKGAVIWKVYNMGFIVRTKSVTIAFDLVSGASSGSDGFQMKSEKLDRMVRQCDVLFISHKHHDHAEKDVAEKFISLGLPVVAPEEVWQDEKIFKQITHLDRIPDKIQKLKLSGDKVLDVIIYPGHQMRSADVNVALVTTPEGITVAHLGDQTNEGDFMSDFLWIDNVAKNHNVDIMMPTALTNDILRIVKGFNPRLVIPGHELELGHSIWDRHPFWGDDDYLGLNYSELKKSKYPVVAMIWGESYHYYPKTDKKKLD